MRVIVCGSRDMPNRGRVWAALDKLRRPVVIVHGACKTGADEHTRNWCYEMRNEGVTEEAHPADWGRGHCAGPERNSRMAKLGADVCLAFWNGRSNGTCDMIRKATAAGIPVRVIPVKER